MSVNIANDAKSAITRNTVSSQGFERRTEKVAKHQLFEKLMEKFSLKYGKSKPLDRIYLEQIVSDFLQKGKVDENGLINLERNISKMSQQAQFLDKFDESSKSAKNQDKFQTHGGAGGFNFIDSKRKNIYSRNNFTDQKPSVPQNDITNFPHHGSVDQRMQSRSGNNTLNQTSPINQNLQRIIKPQDEAQIVSAIQSRLSDRKFMISAIKKSYGETSQTLQTQPRDGPAATGEDQNNRISSAFVMKGLGMNHANKNAERNNTSLPIKFRGVSHHEVISGQGEGMHKNIKDDVGILSNNFVSHRPSTQGKMRMSDQQDNEHLNRKNLVSAFNPDLQKTNYHSYGESIASKFQSMNDLNLNSGLKSGSQYPLLDKQTGFQILGMPANWQDMSDDSSDQEKEILKIKNDGADQWAALLKLDAELFKKQEEIQRKKEFESQKKIAAELAQQVQEREIKQQREKEEDKQYAIIRDLQIEKLDLREREQEEERKNLDLMGKGWLDEQQQLIKLKQRVEKKHEKQLGKYIVQKYQEDVMQQNSQKTNKRDFQRRFYSDAIQKDQHWQQMKDEQDKHRKEEEEKSSKQHGQLLDQIQINREQNLKSIHDKYHSTMNQWDQNYQQLYLQRQKQLELESEQTQRQIEQHEKKERELNQQKKKRLQQEYQKINEELQYQLFCKKKKAQKQKYMDSLQAEMWKDDEKQFNQSEKEKLNRIQNANMYNFKALRQQISTNEESQKLGQMTVNELLQNQQKFQELSQISDTGFQFEAQQVQSFSQV